VELCCFEGVDLWPETWSYDTYSATIERIVDGALGALRRALDAIPYHADVAFDRRKEPQHYPECRVIELWIELMVACDAVLYQARLKESRTGASFSGDARSRKDGGDLRRENHAMATLDERQQLRVFLDLWLDWSRTHRFEGFAAIFDEPRILRRRKWLMRWREERRRLFLFKVSSKSPRRPRRRKVRAFSRRLTKWCFRTLWRCRHPDKNRGSAQDSRTEEARGRENAKTAQPHGSD
jgi:hypothetical protein